MKVTINHDNVDVKSNENESKSNTKVVSIKTNIKYGVIDHVVIHAVKEFFPMITYIRGEVIGEDGYACEQIGDGESIIIYQPDKNGAGHINNIDDEVSDDEGDDEGDDDDEDDDDEDDVMDTSTPSATSTN